MRIFQLAKELNVDSKEILDALEDMGLEAKSNLSPLDDAVVAELRDLFKPKPVRPSKEEALTRAATEREEKERAAREERQREEERRAAGTVDVAPLQGGTVPPQERRERSFVLGRCPSRRLAVREVHAQEDEPSVAEKRQEDLPENEELHVGRGRPDDDRKHGRVRKRLPDERKVRRHAVFADEDPVVAGRRAGTNDRADCGRVRRERPGRSLPVRAADRDGPPPRPVVVRSDERDALRREPRSLQRRVEPQDHRPGDVVVWDDAADDPGCDRKGAG